MRPRRRTSITSSTSPNDPEVITDLGTMYLYTNNADQAVVQYKKAIAIKPDMFQPYYNLGVAYGEQGDKGDSAIAFTKAISLAPDDDRRNPAKQAFTKYTGMSADAGRQDRLDAAGAEARRRQRTPTTAANAGRRGRFPFVIRGDGPQHPVRGAESQRGQLARESQGDGDDG